MTEQELVAIEARAERAGEHSNGCACEDCGYMMWSDTKALVAEVRRLRTALEGPVCFCAECAGGITSHTMNMATGHLVCGECDAKNRNQPRCGFCGLLVPCGCSMAKNRAHESPTRPSDREG